MSEYFTDDARIIPRLLSGFARQALELQPQNQFILERWLPNVTVGSRRWATDEGSTQDFTSTARRRAFNTPPRVTGRPGKSRLSGDMAPLGEKKVLIESEIEALQSGVIPQSTVDTVFDDVGQLVIAGRNRMEIDRAQVLELGKIVVEDEDGLWMEADMKRKAARATSVVTAWSDAVNSTPLADETTFVRQIRDEEGERPAFGICTPEVVDALRVNEQYLSASRDVREPSEISLEEINEIRVRKELPPLIEYEARVEHIDGTVGRVVNPNKILYVPSGAVGSTQWGRPVIASEPGVEIEQGAGGPVIVLVRHQNVPVSYETVMDAITMATLTDADKTGALEVLGV